MNTPQNSPFVGRRAESDPFHNKSFDLPQSIFPRNTSHVGWLDIRTRSNKPWKRRYFVLANNFLLSAVTPYAAELERAIPLEGITVSRPKTSELSFQISTKRKSYCFRASTAEDAANWTALLCQASVLKIKDIYRFIHALGSTDGQNTKVVAARHRITGLESAIKIVNKRHCDHRALANEVQILKQLDNPHIVPLHDLFETKHYLYLVMEKCEGGELFERISELDGGHYTEQQSCSIIHQIAQGVKYMHSMGIVHRDLKPENILCVSNLSLDHVKIADFGISKIVNSPDNNNNMKTPCGTPLYTAPEVLRGVEYDKSVDYWSIGVIMHILLVGYAPFDGDTDQELQRNIIHQDLELDPEDWAHVSEQGKALVKGLLDKDPARRKGVEDILKHTWIESSRGIVQGRSFFRARRRFTAKYAKRRLAPLPNVANRQTSMSQFEKSSQGMAKLYRLSSGSSNEAEERVSSASDTSEVSDVSELTVKVPSPVSYESYHQRGSLVFTDF